MLELKAFYFRKHLFKGFGKYTAMYSKPSTVIGVLYNTKPEKWYRSEEIPVPGSPNVVVSLLGDGCTSIQWITPSTGETMVDNVTMLDYYACWPQFQHLSPSLLMVSHVGFHKWITGRVKMVAPQGLFCCGQGRDRIETLLNCSFTLAGNSCLGQEIKGNNTFY